MPEPLVLLHGFTAGPAVWDPVVPLLREHHDVRALALAGHRGGPPLAAGEEPTIAGYVDALERELREEGLAPAHLVGNSLGGWVALELAARGLAKSVVALAPAGGWQDGSPFARALIAQFGVLWLAGRLLTPDAMKRPKLRHAFMSGAVARPERVPALAAAGVIEDLRGCATLGPTVLRRRRRVFADLQRIDCPVRIAWSGEDKLLLAAHAQARFRQMLPDAEELTLPGVGHVPMSDDPQLVARTILEVTSPAA